MAKKKIQAEPVNTVEMDVKGLNEEQTVDYICNSLDTLCASLEEAGLDPELVTASLFRLFAEHMCESGDRATYEQVLELALEDEWEDVTLH